MKFEGLMTVIINVMVC